MKIDYRQLKLDKVQILNLYKDAKWDAYTENPDNLINAIVSSKDCIGAYLNERLIGLIRTIGDGISIIYIQDLLVLKEFQRQGIGKTLVELILDKYSDVRQITLMTDDTENTSKFYQSCGFKPMIQASLMGYYYLRKKDE